MRFGLVLAAAVMVWVSMARADDEALAADYYVSLAGNDAWSGELAQADAGKTDGPFATVGRAKEVMRKRIAAGLKADVKVLIRGGVYYLRDGVAFGVEDSGSAQHRVTWAAYRDEVPVLVGGVPVEGWTAYKGAIRQAAIPAGMSPRQLFEGRKRLELARMPDAGYLTVESSVAGRERQAFTYHAGDLALEGSDLTGARVFCWPTHNWHSEEQPLQGIDTKTRTITLAGQTSPMKPGNRWLLRNLLAALDQPGECQIDLAGRKMHAWGRSGEAIIASTSPSLLAIDGGKGTVRNLHFAGLDLSISNGPAVRFNGAEDCSIKSCTIENAAEYGVVIQGKSQRITVCGNLIRYHGRSGIALLGPGAGQPESNHHHTIENNHIHSCGALVGHSYGVEISQSGHNKIIHNLIHDMPRYGVSIKGPRYGILRQQTPGVTWENHYDFLHGRNNLIAYNHIHHVNTDSQDTGAFEAWGPGRDNVIDHNLIHDVGNREFDLQSGIYLDDAADHFTVSNNIIYNIVGTRGNQPIYAKGIGNRIINNILIVHPSNDSAIRSYAMADERCDHHEYARNIIYIDGPKESAKGAWGTAAGNLHDKGKTLSWKIDVPAEVNENVEVRRHVYQFDNYSEDRITASDSNLFWSTAPGTLSVRGGPADGSLEKWRGLGNGKYDRTSIVADPMFVDPAKHDYRLKAESPALKLGFVPIDASRIGLKEDFPERLRR